MNNICYKIVFCENFTRLRQIKGLSQKEMAKAVGISVQSVCKIEKGVLPKRLNANVLFSIKQFFGIYPSDMLTKNYFDGVH